MRTLILILLLVATSAFADNGFDAGWEAGWAAGWTDYHGRYSIVPITPIPPIPPIGEDDFQGGFKYGYAVDNCQSQFGAAELMRQIHFNRPASASR